MIRTRVFLLFLACAAFLVVGIGVTGLSQLFTFTANDTPVTFNDVEFTSEVAETIDLTLDRQQRLLELQTKIADRGGVIAQPASTVVFADTEVNNESDEIVITEGEISLSDIQYCDVVNTVARAWPAIDIVSLEREGRRVYLTETSQAVTTQVGTTTATETVVTENIYTHLPIRSTAGQATCIGQDVIGIAQDGSLLRNANYAAYSIFGSETLIGYALDGLPIYGVSTTITTDACGGATMGGQYRYYLSSERPGMLGCFAAQPVTL